jgi:hypothetical protein
MTVPPLEPRAAILIIVAGWLLACRNQAFGLPAGIA